MDPGENKKYALDEEEAREFALQRLNPRRLGDWDQDKKTRYRKWWKHAYYLARKEMGATRTPEYLERVNERSKRQYREACANPTKYKELRAKQRIYERRSKRKRKNLSPSVKTNSQIQNAFHDCVLPPQTLPMPPLETLLFDQR